ncbi:MAG: hypothetical protein KGH84_14025 [Paracoccaceae bacterium]|nr:hypothetical protein [Paracoccaceae bacterium]
MARIHGGARLNPNPRHRPPRLRCALLATLAAVLCLCACEDSETQAFVKDNPELVRLMTQHRVNIIEQRW